MGRSLGIDHGEKRTGLALGDPTGTIASPLAVVSGDDELLAEVERLVREEEVDRIVVGLPLNMDGSVGPRARKALELKARLERHLAERSAASPITVDTWDERLTTMQADAALRSGGLSPAKRRARVDKVAAQILLQSYLDGQGRKAD